MTEAYPKTKADSAHRMPSLSALGLFLLLCPAVYLGAEIVAFEALAERAAPPVSKSLGQAIDVSLKPSVSKWSDVTGVATRARRLLLKIIVAETPGDMPGIEEALSEVLQTSPTMASAWQALVAARSARQAPTETVLAAFRMSAFTASHEGSLMFQRAIFGLEHWAALPDSDRHTVIRDVLATAMTWDFGREGKRYRAILGAKSQTERDDIRAALIASGLGTKNVLKALAL